MLIPVIRVKDRMTGSEHIVGTNSHDCLLLFPGRLEYYNLQNGCGSADAYDFICEEHDPKEWWEIDHVEMVTLDEWIMLSKQEMSEAVKNKIAFYRAFTQLMQDEVEQAQKETGITGDTAGEILE